MLDIIDAGNLAVNIIETRGEGFFITDKLDIR
jgi:hypothetical protein